ncbi:MAG: hypothetical protein OXH22_00325 [Chloroflexi bacterium]|nr:hypothetical protein [Chloroflexota bacterium]
MTSIDKSLVNARLEIFTSHWAMKTGNFDGEMTIVSRTYLRVGVGGALIALVMICGLALGGVRAIAVAQQAPVTIAGQVVNASPGADSAVGLAVVLHMQGADSYDNMTTITDGDGNFAFEGILYDPELAYGVSVRYQDALYGTEIGIADGATTEVVIEVYDAIYEQDVIRVGSASLLFADADRVTQTVSALEIVKVVNDSDFTFVPGSEGPMSLLRFGLPPGAEGLQVDTRLLGADVVQVDRGFAVIGSVPPGEHDIMFTYAFPYDGDRTTIEKSFPFGADNLRVLSPDEVLTLGSADLGAPESISIGERPYQLIETADIERGRRVEMQLTGLPRASLADRAQATVANARYEYAAPALLVVFLTALIPFAVLRHRARRAAAAPADVAAAEHITDDVADGSA